MANLVMMRRSDEDNGPFPGDIERAAGSDFTEEYVSDHAPEKQGSIVDNVRVADDLR